MTKLSQAEVDAFHRDGYYAPVDVFGVDEARSWRADLEAFEATLPPGPVSAGNRRKLHVRCPWARDLVGDPRLLDVMEFDPRARHPGVYQHLLHQGADSPAPSPPGTRTRPTSGCDRTSIVTAWVALSEASVRERAACEFVPGHAIGGASWRTAWRPFHGDHQCRRPLDQPAVRHLDQPVFAPVKTGRGLAAPHSDRAQLRRPNRSSDRSHRLRHQLHSDPYANTAAASACRRPSSVAWIASVISISRTIPGS